MDIPRGRQRCHPRGILVFCTFHFFSPCLPFFHNTFSSFPYPCSGTGWSYTLSIILHPITTSITPIHFYNISLNHHQSFLYISLIPHHKSLHLSFQFLHSHTSPYVINRSCTFITIVHKRKPGHGDMMYCRPDNFFFYVSVSIIDSVIVMC